MDGIWLGCGRAFDNEKHKCVWPTEPRAFRDPVMEP